jgi:hypothetical protein
MAEGNGIRGLQPSRPQSDPDGRAPVRDGVAVLPDTEVLSLRRRVKGGSYLYRPFNCRVDGPGSALAANRVDYNGFRLFRAWP